MQNSYICTELDVYKRQNRNGSGYSRNSLTVEISRLCRYSVVMLSKIPLTHAVKPLTAEKYRRNADTLKPLVNTR